MGREPLRRWDPERIGPYVILGRLGAGAMGQVYLGRSPAGRLVAVKTVKVELAEEAGFRTRFALEVAAARRVSGAFTAAVVGADPDADLPWLATAYVPAPSLSRLVRASGPLPVATVRWLAAGCAEALESIHAVGLVHRDLKPSNVLVAPDGPRVIDFGVARAAERMALTTARGTVGTPAYMAPEQARDTRQASAASDVYSLGATLVFAATGHPPYAGDTVMEVLARLATEEPDLSGMPAELTPLVTDCMQRAPRTRPTSSEVLARLGQFAQAPAGPLVPAGEHSYLPESAMALIAEYQQAPHLGAPAEPDGDVTSASYTELPASYRPPARRRSGRGGPGHVTAGGGGAGWRRWLRTHVAWAGWLSVGAALVVVGVILGASLSSSSAPRPEHTVTQAAGPPASPPSAPATVCHSSAGSGRNQPSLCMVGRSQGESGAAFVVRGSGFAPRTSVTVKVSEADPQNRQIFAVTSRDKPVTGADGTFRVPVSQLYSGPLGLGLVTVEVTGSGGTASTQFMVIPPGPPPGGQ
jgi:hypothetical protein